MKKTASKFGALIASIAMVLVAVGALTTASYAWFTNSLTATVSDMTIQASTSKALLVSAEANGTFGTSVGEDVLWAVETNRVTKTKAGATWTATENQTRKITSVTPSSIVTSANTSITDANAVIGFQQLKDSFIPTTSGEWNAGDAYDAAAVPGLTTETASYLQFDLYFKASFGTDAAFTQNLVLDLTSTTGTPASAYAGTTVINETNQQLSKSIRYAFISSKTANPSSITTNAANTVTVFAPSSEGDHIAVGAQVPVDENKTGYAKRNLGATSALSPVNGATFSAPNMETTDLVLLEDITSDTVYQVRVVIWVEGNDIDCANLVSSDELTSSLVFKLAPVATSGS